MQQFKNVALHPVDVGGRILASGEVAELSPHAPAVHEAVTSGHLLALATFQEAREQPERVEEPGAEDEASPQVNPEEQSAKSTRKSRES